MVLALEGQKKLSRPTFSCNRRIGMFPRASEVLERLGEPRGSACVLGAYENIITPTMRGSRRGIFKKRAWGYVLPRQNHRKKTRGNKFVC